jgi:homoserine dehydrogenase
MTHSGLSFDAALKKAQQRGYAESDPTLDINGMDSAHKLAIMSFLSFGKFLKVTDIYTEGISLISHEDIEYASSLGLIIKLLTIAKKEKNEIEVRVHPTLIPKEHPLASVNGVYNAIYLHLDPLGNVLLSGEGAGKMAAASGVVSDLINLATNGYKENLACNFYSEASKLKLKKIDQINTRFYIRLKAIDKPGVLSKITGILGANGIGINSVTQKIHNRAEAVPLIMLTDYTTEKKLRSAINKIEKLAVVKGTPVAIRMEKL